MKYKVGDKVRIKSIDWYNENKDSNGNVVFSSKVTHFSWRENVRTVFTKDMSKFCGKVVTIETVWTVNYSIVEGTNIDYFTDEMIEGLVDEEIIDLTSIVMKTVEEKTIQNALTYGYNLPEGYQFVDEGDNVINATKIVLKKKKKEYPKTYEECSIINGAEGRISLSIIGKFTKLINARNAYWRIAGKEMGLGKSWEPDWTNQELPKYCIASVEGEVKTAERYIINTILAFPSEEIRDVFYENFKEEIEICKKFL